MLGRLGPKQNDRALAGLRADLQAPELFLSGLRKPGQQRATGVRLYELLGDPEPLSRCIGLHPDEVVVVQPSVTQARQMWSFGRSNHHDGLASCDKPAQGRPEQPPLAHGWLRLEDFGHRPAGPATSR